MKIRLPDPVAPEQTEALSRLEAGLRGPDAPLLREQIQAQLEELEHRTRRALLAGAPPQRYGELAALLDACLAAHDVVGSSPPPLPGSSMGACVRLN